MSEEAKQLQRQLDQVQRQLQRLESVSRNVWQSAGVGTPGDTPVYYLSCLKGNLLQTVGSTDYYGLKRPSSVITSVPATTPPTADGACANGLTAATLIANDGATSTVWAGVRLKPGDVELDQYPGVLSYQSPFVCNTIVMMPLATDSAVFVKVYSVWRI